MERLKTQTEILPVTTDSNPHRPLVIGLIVFGLVAALLLGAEFYFLWKPRADQVSGDTLIHMVFARNLAAGRPFDFNIGYFSRALTSPAWNWLLAGVGVLLDLSREREGFLMLFRALSVVTMGVALGFVWRLARLLRADAIWSLGAVLIVALNPCTFYWVVANPMETAMACVVALLIGLWTFRAAKVPAGGVWFVGGLLAGLGFLTRPELMVFGGTGALAAFVFSRERRWAGLILFAVGLGLVLGLWVLYLNLMGVAVMPNAGSTRRLMLMLDDVRPMPVTGWPWSPDCLLFLLLFLPFFAGALLLPRMREPGIAAVVAAVVAMTGFCVIFFTFYFPTTWQGRYLLPLVSVVVPVGAAGLSEFSKRLRGVWVVSAVAIYAIVLGSILLRPLAVYADAPRQRSLPPPGDVVIPNGARILLCQEIQSAWFHPELFHVCTEGLIGLESMDARRRGLSVLEFIRETRPDLIGTGRYPLEDPEGVVKTIREAAEARRDAGLPGLRLVYLGEMPGCGSVFRCEWDSSLRQ
jgi:hypothetical protein